MSNYVVDNHFGFRELKLSQEPKGPPHSSCDAPSLSPDSHPSFSLGIGHTCCWESNLMNCIGQLIPDTTLSFFSA